MIHVQCVICNTTHEVPAKYNDYVDWKKGKGAIQTVMPYLTADQRELLISGICPSCWNKTFGGDNQCD